MSKELKRTREEQILQDWIPSGQIETRFFNYENMIAFAKHYSKDIESKLKEALISDKKHHTLWVVEKMKLQAVKDSLMSDEEIDNYKIDGTKISPLGVKALREQREQIKEALK